MGEIQETAEIRAEQNYQKFRTTKQETLRLQAALAGFFEEEKAGITAERKGEYAAYLKKRIRPALQALLKENRIDEMEKLQKNVGGIKEMKKVPDMMFIVDTRKERIAVQEAHTLGIPTVAIVDTNCDPDEIDYVIPGNDDAIRAVKLIASKVADAVLESKQGEQEAAETETVEAE